MVLLRICTGLSRLYGAMRVDQRHTVAHPSSV